MFQGRGCEAEGNINQWKTELMVFVIQQLFVSFPLSINHEMQKAD